MRTRLMVAIAIVLGGVAAGCTSLTSPHADPSPPSTEARADVQLPLGRLRSEARIAADHVGFALRRPHELRWMQREIRHVRHALEPASEEDGPGLGHGVLPSADAVLAALRSGPPTEWSREGTVDRLEPARSAIERVARAAHAAMVLADSVLAEADSAERAARWVSAIEVLVARVRAAAGPDEAPLAHAEGSDGPSRSITRR